MSAVPRHAKTTQDLSAVSPRGVTGTEARAPVLPARAAVTTCRRPFDGRQGRASRGSGGWRSTAREPAGWASGERPAAVSLGSRAVGSEHRFLRVLPLTRVPVLMGPTLATSSNPSHRPEATPPNASHWESGFQPGNLGGHTLGARHAPTAFGRQGTAEDP